MLYLGRAHALASICTILRRITKVFVSSNFWGVTKASGSVCYIVMTRQDRTRQDMTKQEGRIGEDWREQVMSSVWYD